MQMSMQHQDMLDSQQHDMNIHPKTSLPTTMAITSLLGIGCLATASVGLHIWSKSEWLSSPGPYPRTWEGYDVVDFFGVLAFFALGPVGMCLLYTVFQHLLRTLSQRHNPIMVIAMTLFAISLLAGLTFFGVTWGWDLLQCGVVGCLNTAHHTWPPSNPPIAEAGSGFKTTVGLPLIITSVALILTLLAALKHNLSRHSYNKQHQTLFDHTGSYQHYTEPLLDSDRFDENPLPKNVHIKRYSPYNTHVLSSSRPHALSDSSDFTKRRAHHMKYWLWFFIYALFLVMWYTVSTYFPNNWEYFYSSRIAQKAATKISDDPQLCYNKWKEYTCPEHDNATFITRAINLTPQVQLKLYPSNTIFYAMLLAIPFFALVLQTFSFSINKFFSRKIRVPRPWNAAPRDRVAFFTLYELSTMVVVVVAMYLFAHYWFFDHNFNGYWPVSDDDHTYGIHISERISRSLGQVAVFVFAMLMFPAARNSPLLAMLGISWESSIKYHRWLGTLFFLFTMGHVVATYWWFYKKGSLTAAINIPMHIPSGWDNFTVPLIQVFVVVMVFTIGVFSICLPNFRRGRVGVFKYKPLLTTEQYLEQEYKQQQYQQMEQQQQQQQQYQHYHQEGI